MPSTCGNPQRPAEGNRPPGHCELLEVDPGNQRVEEQNFSSPLSRLSNMDSL